ncbi:MAG: SMC-Scp complex subunit ScpB [Verrucomicrobia bacterium]|jgi:segregation and condensation protein B|nr:SMC-Scp complex subunit ScpB [Verrucomicrobiota bacterium]MBT7067555.1 SMC-Scp complex subunit ScpB [Verrucomicrobiota bacterium]MBT7698712.1 SMC-Scp complex subunit ScpB [Verrucomicrobiota bacterium]
MDEQTEETLDSDALELKQVIGAMIFGANRSLSLKEMKRTLRAVGEEAEGPAKVYATIREGEIAQTLEQLIIELDQLKAGIHIAEVAGGFRYQSDPQCGIWLRHLLEKGKPSRLSQPGLETLAVIAYRQPMTRAQIEAIRGVSVDHVVRKLLEMQLIRIAGRSELPGRPFMYATTHYFLEHFGLRDLNQLEEVNPMLKRRDAAVSVETAQKEATGAAESGEAELPLAKAEAPETDTAPAAETVDVAEAEPASETTDVSDAEPVAETVDMPEAEPDAETADVADADAEPEAGEADKP